LQNESTIPSFFLKPAEIRESNCLTTSVKTDRQGVVLQQGSMASPAQPPEFYYLLKMLLVGDSESARTSSLLNR
jgi:hypothetical protein